MPAFFLDSMWRRVKKPKISTSTIPIAMPGKGTAVEVVSNVNGRDSPEIWAMAPTEKSRKMTIPERSRVKLFIVKWLLMSNLKISRSG
jgi:hypothetical protein